MSLHDEEMQRRREKREAQRRRQEAERRKMKRRLVLTMLVILTCGAGIWFLTQKAGIWGVSAPTVQETQPRPTEPKQEPVRPTARDPITTIHIKAAGDLVVTNSVIDAGKAATGYDYSRVFQDVSAVLSDADLTVLNFEGNVCGEPYGTDTSSAPPELLRGLRSAGVDLLQVANSSIINNGISGMTSTLNAIRDAGMEPVGAFANAQELKTSKGYTITEVQGIKVAFVAFTKGVGGRGMPSGQEDLVNLLYTDYASDYQEIDKVRIERIMKNLQAERPDIVVAMLHWGSAYNETVSKSQNQLVSLLQKQGVDIILGTHPHTLQTIDYNEDENTLVAYSLGDFFGDAERGGTNYSIILDIEITKDATTGSTRVTDYSYTPIYTVKSSECSGYQKSERRIVRVDKAIEAFDKNFLDKVSQTSVDGMKYALERIEIRKLTDEQKKELEEQEKLAKQAAQGK